MKKQPIMIGNIPAVIWGEPSDRVFLFVHGRQASKEAAEVFAGIAAEKGIRILKELPVSQHRDFMRFLAPVWPNLLASNAIFVISK